jgi:hypothetical protein
MPITTLGDAITYARTIARDQAGALTDATGLSFANDFNREARKILVLQRKNLFVETAYNGITADEIVGGSQPGRFLFPDDMLLLKYIELNVAKAGDPENFVSAEILDASNLPEGWSLDDMRDKRDTFSPAIDVRGDWFEVLPTPTEVKSDSLRAVYHVIPTIYTTTADLIDYPMTLDPEALAYGIAYKYLEPLNAERAKTLKEDVFRRVEEIIKLVGTGTAMPTQAQPLRMTGWNQ